MNIIIIKDRLKEALSILSKATSSKESLPILKNICFTVENDTITLSATDLEIGITYKLRGKVIEEGSTTVPLHILLKAVNNITHDRLNISLEDNFLHITTDDYEAKIYTTGSEDFPLIPSIEEKESYIEIENETFKTVLEKVTTPVQFSDLRPELNSVLFSYQMDSAILVTTDSFRLSEYTLSGNQIESKNIKEFQILIPLSTAKYLAQILPNSEQVIIRHDDTQVSFETENFTLVSRLVEGNFPEYENIIPKDFEVEITMNKKELINAVKLSSVFSGENNDITFKKSENKHIELYSHADTKGENISRIPAKITGEFEEIRFNWRYLNEGLSVINSEKLWIGLNDESKPTLFKTEGDERFFYLLMPILSD